MGDRTVWRNPAADRSIGAVPVRTHLPSGAEEEGETLNSRQEPELEIQALRAPISGMGVSMDIENSRVSGTESFRVRVLPSGESRATEEAVYR